MNKREVLKIIKRIGKNKARLLNAGPKEPVFAFTDFTRANYTRSLLACSVGVFYGRALNNKFSSRLLTLTATKDYFK